MCKHPDAYLSAYLPSGVTTISSPWRKTVENLILQCSAPGSIFLHIEKNDGCHFCVKTSFPWSDSSFSWRNLSVAQIVTGKRNSTYGCPGACSQAGRRTITLIAYSNRDSDVFDYMPEAKYLQNGVSNVSMYNVASPENRKTPQKYGKCFILKRTKQSRTI